MAVYLLAFVDEFLPKVAKSVALSVLKSHFSKEHALKIIFKTQNTVETWWINLNLNLNLKNWHQRSELLFWWLLAIKLFIITLYVGV